MQQENKKKLRAWKLTYSVDTYLGILLIFYGEYYIPREDVGMHFKPSFCMSKDNTWEYHIIVYHFRAVGFLKVSNQHSKSCH